MRVLNFRYSCLYAANNRLKLICYIFHRGGKSFSVEISSVSAVYGSSGGMKGGMGGKPGGMMR